MKVRGKVRALAITAVSVAAVGGGLLSAGAASAAPTHSGAVLTAVRPATGTFNCGGNVCVGLTSSSGAGVYTVRTYPPNFTFYGHFQLQTPNHKTINSKDSTWHAGGTGNIFNNVAGGNGEYCATAYQQTQNGGYNDIGYACIDS